MAEQSPSVLQRLAALIEAEGPIRVGTYMALANAHYYGTRDPLGSAGDFTTAPEISQMFGELVGLWMADLWMRAGSPHCAIVELGPGRGTLMADLRRATSRVPGLAEAPVHFVETSAVLRQAQADRVPEASWHDGVHTLPDDRPLLIVANEFFDALPVHQFIKTEDGWHDRRVMIKEDRVIPVPGPLSPESVIPATFTTAPVGSIIETSPASNAIIADLSQRLVERGGAALVIDYGYIRPSLGDTLQAVKGHAFADVFANPGEVDLTAHVDFAALGEAAGHSGARTHGPVGQGAFLEALGIETRVQRLASANPAQAQSLTLDKRRLVAPEEMGTLFKAMAIAAPSWPVPAGFEV